MNEDLTRMTAAEELTAWNQWKEVCYVNGCSEKEKKYLQRRVVAKLSRELRLRGVDLISDTRLQAEDLVTEFDLYLACKKAPDNQKNKLENKQGQTRTKRDFKEHKEHVWQKVASSQDPPMKVINGMLLGDRSVAMEVVRNIMRKYFDAQTEKVVQQESGRIVRRQIMPASLQNNQENEKSWEEMLADTTLPKPDEMAMTNKSELKISMREILKKLSQAETVVLLAGLKQISASDELVCNALHSRKSTACALAKQVRDKLARWRLQSQDAPNVMTLEVHEVLCEMITEELKLKQCREMRNFLRHLESLA